MYRIINYLFGVLINNINKKLQNITEATTSSPMNKPSLFL